MNPLPMAIATGMPPGIMLLMIFIVAFKGLALFRAAKLDQKYWFIFFLFVNTFGLLELIYVFFLAKEKMKFNDLFFWRNFSAQKKSK